MGCLWPGGQRGCWPLVVTATVMMLVGRCSGHEAPEIAKDCVVYHLGSNSSSPDIPFRETLSVGFPPQTNHKVFSGLSFLVTNDIGNTTIHFKDSSATRTMCSQDGHPATEGGTAPPFTSDLPFKWGHVTFSQRNEDISIKNKKVCSITTPSGEESFFKVTTRLPTNIVFNCKNGCPIYMDSSIVMFKNKDHLSKENIYFQRTNANASASLRVVNKKSRSSQGHENLIQDIHLKYPTNTNTWKQLAFSVRPKKKTGLAYELKVGQDLIWHNVTIREDDLPETFLQLKSSQGIEWAVDCDPRQYEPKDTTTSEPVDKNEPRRKLSWMGLFIALILLVIILAVAFFIMIKMRLMNRLRSAIANLSTEPPVDNELTSANPAPAYSQGSSSKNNILEKGRRGPPAYPPHPPNHSTYPPVPQILLPSNNLCIHQEYDYDDINELMVPQSSNIGCPLSDQTPTPSPKDKRISNSGPFEDNSEEEHNYCYIDRQALMTRLNMDKQEKRKMKDIPSGTDDRLTHHESVNSLDEELKETATENGQRLSRHESVNSL